MISTCHVQIHWLTREEGGRHTPILAGRYIPTARFAGEKIQFGVGLECLASDEANPKEGILRLLNPDLVETRERIRPGVALEFMEGPRVVALCVVSEVYEVVAASH